MRTTKNIIINDTQEIGEKRFIVKNNYKEIAHFNNLYDAEEFAIKEAKRENKGVVVNGFWKIKKTAEEIRLEKD